jgi:hypothetical protein
MTRKRGLCGVQTTMKQVLRYVANLKPRGHEIYGVKIATAPILHFGFGF